MRSDLTNKAMDPNNAVRTVLSPADKVFFNSMGYGENRTTTRSLLPKQTTTAFGRLELESGAGVV